MNTKIYRIYDMTDYVNLPWLGNILKETKDENEAIEFAKNSPSNGQKIVMEFEGGKGWIIYIQNR